MFKDRFKLAGLRYRTKKIGNYTIQVVLIHNEYELERWQKYLFFLPFK